jgi:hypothetical protein
MMATCLPAAVSRNKEERLLRNTEEKTFQKYRRHRCLSFLLYFSRNTEEKTSTCDEKYRRKDKNLKTSYPISRGQPPRNVDLVGVYSGFCRRTNKHKSSSEEEKTSSCVEKYRRKDQNFCQSPSSELNIQLSSTCMRVHVNVVGIYIDVMYCMRTGIFMCEYLRVVCAKLRPLSPQSPPISYDTLHLL